MGSQHSTPQPEDLDARAPVRVLVAEDEPTQRLMLSGVLTRAGYEVDTAADGVEALARMREGDYMMLITDWAMPGLDGPSLCRQVRAAQLAHYVYIVILTGERGADVLSGFDAGADDYVQKTTSKDELLARLAAGARIVRLERSLRAARSRIELLSVTDPLLPIFNRRYLGTQLEKEIERVRRYHRSLSVVMADIDRFKQVNDSHGHRVGDEVLLAFCGLVTARLRATDWVARYGGEEFLFVLPETDSSGALVVAESLRAAWADASISTSRGNLHLTASFGVASLDDGRLAARAGAHEALEPLLSAADEALYRSKTAGRNRVTLAGSRSPGQAAGEGL